MTPDDVTLGLLAGGRAARLGGTDKAWLVRDGVPQVLRWQRRFAAEVAEVLVGANRDLPRYAQAGLRAVPDRVAGQPGPVAGLDALAAACATPWLLTLPVDLVGVNECLLPTLASAGRHGAYAVDDDGVQPLVALWDTSALRDAAARALVAGEYAVQALQAGLGMAAVRLPGVRFGNLNTPADLAAAGIEPPR
ncbi:molybdenum cofactor guanylyltransferase [Vulcaniibacterium tengchongense]|uniref:Molybdopterin-guanine dinucleotide biosynthesis protein A n=1 Tax=Vulcaniibacterium tengchongense TaxID=1273429 RepID=A0A3N4W6I8_9GAMM|nr:NTP transferase domain-containing protein [Vulcaniibacterium tengchongense]RPE81700.1 molybdopterin-guanine dinucleotide biosynthesis protein A [Vulcaniibacterium tengchongense]